MTRSSSNDNGDTDGDGIDNGVNSSKLEHILSILESGKYISGQTLAGKVGISRSAVWKHIRHLRRYGYTIESLHGMGYRLIKRTDSPVPWELAKLLNTSFLGKKIIIYRNITDSTQDLALSFVSHRRDFHGIIILAEQQKNGRGRLKRKWLSPKGGLWLSIILKPVIPTSRITLLPLVAAIAVCNAIRQETKLNATLKWPNDIVIHGKKVAGILLDISAEAEQVNYAIIGIGINVNIDASAILPNLEDFQKVTSIKSELGHDANRLALTKTLLENLEQRYVELETYENRSAIINKWKQMSEMFGKQVKITQGGRLIEGTAMDLNDNDGSLLLRTNYGTNICITSGDIKVRY